MTSSSRPIPRFLPTLTEVVRPAELEVPSAPDTSVHDALLATVMHRIEARLAERLAQEWDFQTDNALTRHLNSLHDQLRLELQRDARQYVSEALGQLETFHKEI